ncbi:MAG: TonB-dependent receptor [Pseudomonadota bacterium]
MRHCQTAPYFRQPKAILSVSVALAALMAGVVPAAASQEPDTAQQEEADETSRLGTITVTGTKREGTLQDTPVAISVVQAEDIERAEIQDLNDLQTLVPSLTVRQGQTSANTSFFIRGFGNGSNAIGIEPSVGIFIDGVYRSRAAAYIPDLPNLERVEVLRGPQSTLFGKNASAGVVSVVTRGPEFERSGSVEASLGNFDAFRAKGDITGPITDTLAYSLSGSVNQRDGYAEDLGTGDLYNERNRWGVRGELLFAPNERLNIRLIADYDEIDEDCCLLSNIVSADPTAADPLVPNTSIQALGGSIVAEDPYSYNAFVTFPPTNEIENSGFSLNSNYDLGFATITNIVAFRNSNAVENSDPDTTDLDLFGFFGSDTDIDTFTQEFRLTSNPSDSRFDWMIGAFYFDESIDVDSSVAFGQDFRAYVNGLVGNPALIPGLESFVGVPPGAFLGAGQGSFEEVSQENEAFSVFGKVDFHLTDRLTATVGLNYTEDEKDVSMNVLTTDALATVNLEQIGYSATLANLLAMQGINVQNPASIGPFILGNPQAYAQFQQQALAVAQSPNNPFDVLRGIQIFPPFLSFPNAVEDGQSSDSDTTYTLRLAYDVNDNINVYGTYATGFKASSWNLQRQSAPSSADLIQGNPIVDPITGQALFVTPSSPVTDAGLYTTNLPVGTRLAGPEMATVFELGLKAQFDTVAFNVAVFDQSIEGFQSSVFSGTGGFALRNAEEQSTLGLELDATWRPIPPLTLTFAGTFLDAEYDSFAGGAVDENGNPVDLSGQTPQGIADTQFTVGANFNFRVRNMGGFVRSDWQYVGDSAFSDNLADQAIIEAAGYSREQNILNASAGLMTENGIGVSVWARNLFEDEYLIATSPAPLDGNYNGFPNQPRTFGVTLRKAF